MDFNYQSVGPDCDGGLRRRPNQAAPSGCVRGVYDYRQMAELVQERDCREVKRVARRRLERANAAFAEDYLIVAVRCDVLGRQKKFFDGGAHAALEQNGAIAAAESL